VERCCAAWPDERAWAARARELLGDPALAEAVSKELAAKHVSPDQLRTQLNRLREIWPELCQSLKDQLIPLGKLQQMLRAAGAPTVPEDIGIARARLRRSYWQAFCIRRRFTALDLAVRIGVLDECLDQIFGPGGVWPMERP
jgi:glycerol-1-phosphate dehydrogenase [NAD(P)+]